MSLRFQASIKDDALSINCFKSFNLKLKFQTLQFKTWKCRTSERPQWVPVLSMADRSIKPNILLVICSKSDWRWSTSSTWRQPVDMIVSSVYRHPHERHLLADDWPAAIRFPCKTRIMGVALFSRFTVRFLRRPNLGSRWFKGNLRETKENAGGIQRKIFQNISKDARERIKRNWMQFIRKQE